jgi:hypothetical protein
MRSLCFAVTMLFAACSTQPNPGGTSGGASGGHASGGTTSGGAGDSSGGAGDINGFVGTWTVSGNGTVTCTSCDGGNQQSSGSGSPAAQQYNVVFSLGTVSDLVSIDSAGCVLNWDVAGTTAEILPNQSCIISPQGASQSDTLSIESGTMQLTIVDVDHLTGSGNLTGTLTVGGALTGMTSNVTAQAAGTLIRASH